MTNKYANLAQIIIGGIFILVFFWMIFYSLYLYKDEAKKEEVWTVITYFFGSIEAVVFTIIGFFFGREVNKAALQKAEKENEDKFNQINTLENKLQQYE